MQILFDKYVPICLDTLRVRFKKITPVPDITMVTTLCYLLECLLNPTNTPPDCNKELYELYFVFAAVWAFGGAMFQDQVRVIVGSVNFLLKYLDIDLVEENTEDILCTLDWSNRKLCFNERDKWHKREFSSFKGLNLEVQLANWP